MCWKNRDVKTIYLQDISKIEIAYIFQIYDLIYLKDILQISQKCKLAHRHVDIYRISLRYHVLLGWPDDWTGTELMLVMYSKKNIPKLIQPTVCQSRNLIMKLIILVYVQVLHLIRKSQLTETDFTAYVVIAYYVVV